MPLSVKTFLWSILALAASVGLVACAAVSKPQAVGDHPPVIDEYFASPTVGRNQTWKIFIKAHDPDGDMYEARFRIDQAGVLYDDLLGDVRIQPEFRKEMDGYFYLHPNYAVRGPLLFAYIDMLVSVTLVDAGGRSSRTIELPLRIGGRAAVPDPQGFQNRPLLPVPFVIRVTD